MPAVGDEIFNPDILGIISAKRPLRALICFHFKRSWGFRPRRHDRKGSSEAAFWRDYLKCLDLSTWTVHNGPRLATTT